MTKNTPKQKPDVYSREVWIEFYHESDRGCILMIVSILDTFLETLLDAAIRQKDAFNHEKRNSLLQWAGPLGTFSSRIAMAYLLGHIPSWMYRDLELIRGIRNVFAHGYTKASFASPELVAEVKKLIQPEFDPERELESLLKQVGHGSSVQAERKSFAVARLHFLVTALMIAQAIEKRTKEL